ncbi:MAG: NUDIX hydrolase [Selenomonadaceae bacterium]|nr:NUDIX hydrolase [Selenomonadaceae bacterium]
MEILDEDKNLIEEKISEENVFDGVLLHVQRDTVKLPNGNEATREWVRHPGASSVLPILPNGDIVLVKQYRYPIGKVTLEVPAGKLDKNEDSLNCAMRELEEETGYTADKIKKITTIATTVGFSNELIHLYVAEDLSAGKFHPDDDEFINVVKMPFAEALKKIENGEIFDMKTIISILLYARKK